MKCIIVASCNRTARLIEMNPQAILILRAVALIAEIELAKDLRGFLGLHGGNQHTHRP